MMGKVSRGLINLNKKILNFENKFIMVKKIMEEHLLWEKSSLEEYHGN